MMENRVIIAVDASPNSEEAVKWYLKSAHREGNEITLVYISDNDYYPTFGYRANIPKEKFIEAFKEGKRLVAAIQKKHEDILLKAGVNKGNIRFISECGTPGPTITAIAERIRAHIIVIGRRGQSAIRRTLLGSVSDFVLHHAHVPVCVCPMHSSQ